MKGMQLDQQLCRQCQGQCCQGHPGIWSDPERFFSIFFAGEIPPNEEMQKILDRHQLILRNLDGVLIPAPQTTEDGCIAQQHDGCSYTTAARPCQCLALTPHIDTLLDDRIHCSLPPEFGSGTARKNWRPLQIQLQQVRDLRENNSGQK